ncbi:MAG: hypothetical protein ABI647_06715 [Gemmatimonadota bacterium]
MRHACRTLVKRGHRAAFDALGYAPPRVTLDQWMMVTEGVTSGTALEFELTLSSRSDRAQPLVMDYAIHHRKANGRMSAKVFKWKNFTMGRRSTLKARPGETFHW